MPPGLLRPALVLGLLAFLALAALGARSASAAPVNKLGGCQIFPRSSAWNQRVDDRPVDPRSDTYVQASGVGLQMTATYGTTTTGREYALPVNIVEPDQPGISLRSSQYDVDSGLYPLSTGTQVGGGTDRHAVILQRGTCRLFELWRANVADGQWQAGGAAIWNLRTNEPRIQGRASANAAGLPILPGILNRNDARRKQITHAIAVTLPVIQDAWVSPATHTDGLASDPRFMPMGTRLRMRRDVPTSRLPRQARIIATAMKRYGLIVSDSGGAPNGANYDGFNIGGEFSTAWSERSRRAIEGLRLGDFEVVRPKGRLRRRAS